MIFSLGTKKAKYIVHFTHHIRPESSTILPGTDCAIKKFRTGEIIAVGGSLMNVELDTFNRPRGRKIAFTRALQMTNLDRLSRRKMWKEYFKHCPIK